MTVEAPHGLKESGFGAVADEGSSRPAMPRLGDLEVRVASAPGEIAACQALRYRVFYEEMKAQASPEMAAARRDFDHYDSVCDHLMVIDHARRFGETVVGTYRLLRQEVADAHGGFYTQGEYDVTPLVTRVGSAMRFLELGRSCVHREYRNKPTLELLWLGILSYVSHYQLDVMIGCASFQGTDPDALALPLAFLHHYYLAPAAWRVQAQPSRYVTMDRMAKDAIDVREALRALPPLIKGYIRAGAFVGEGAVIDRQFNTTDVMIIFPVSEINERYFSRFSRVVDKPKS